MDSGLIDIEVDIVPQYKRMPSKFLFLERCIFNNLDVSLLNHIC